MDIAGPLPFIIVIIDLYFELYIYIWLLRSNWSLIPIWIFYWYLVTAKLFAIVILIIDMYFEYSNTFLVIAKQLAIDSDSDSNCYIDIWLLRVIWLFIYGILYWDLEISGPLSFVIGFIDLYFEYYNYIWLLHSN